jgi:hypothetical protein
MVAYYPAGYGSAEQALTSNFLFDWHNWETIKSHAPQFALHDVDGDLISNQDEWLVLQSDPVFRYSLHTTLHDGEVDSDGDGLMNYMELNNYHSNPLLADTDADGLDDGTEVLGWWINGMTMTSDPNLKNTDNDYFTDVEEYIYRFNPRDSVDPIDLSQLKPTSFKDSDTYDKISFFVAGQPRVASFRITVLLFDGASGCWCAYMSTIYTTSGSTSTFSTEVVFTRAGIYSSAMVTIEAFYAASATGLKLGEATSYYYVALSVGSKSGGGGGGPEPAPW